MNGYAAHLDVGSFIDYFLMKEMMLDIDAYRLSTFLNLDVDGKIKAGPVWDS